MYRVEFQLTRSIRYSTNTEYMRQNGIVRQMNDPLLVKFLVRCESGMFSLKSMSLKLQEQYYYVL